MRAKRLFKAIFTIATFYCGFNAYAQAPQYATTVSSQNNVSAVSTENAAKAVDQNLTTRARVNTTNVVVTVEGHIELQFPGTVPANTPAYIKINMQETDQLKALVGGNLGNLLDDVLGIVLGDQYLQVIASNGTTPVLTSTNFGTLALRIVQNGAGDYFIRVTPTADYNRIRINNKLGGLVATRWLDVYDAFYVTGANSCALGNYTSYEGISVTSLLGGNVVNANYAIDSNTTNYSSINLGTLAVGEALQQIVYFEGTSAATDKYNIKLQVSNSLVNLGVLGNIRIIGLKGSAAVYSKPLTDPSLLYLGLAEAFATGNPVSFSISPGVEIDRIAIRYTSLANVGLLPQELRVYGVTRANFGVALTPGTSVQVGSTVALTATVTGCTGPYTYTWTGNGVSSTTNTASVTFNTPGTYTYTVKVTDIYGIEQSASSTFVVEAPPVAGTISSAQSVCSGLLAGNLTLSGYTGNIIKWQRATDSQFTNPVDIVNTAPTLTGSSLGALTETTYIRAVVGRFTYANVNSTPVVLTVKGTTWNGTAWSNGAPDITTTAYFTGNYNVDADITACRIEVSNNAVVNIPSENLVTVEHNIKVVSGTFTLQNNAHLIQQTDEANVGNVTVKRKGSVLYRLDYTLWSSPVTGQPLNTFSPFTAQDRFYQYGNFDQNGDYVEQYINVINVGSLSQPFPVGKSFLIRMPNSINGSIYGGYYAGTQTHIFEGSFTGVPNNGPITYPLQGNLHYTAIGNPYPSPINVQDFFDANEDALAPTTALYFWRKKNNYLASSYAVLTRDAYVYNNADGGNPGEDAFGGKIWDDFFNNDVAPEDWVINPGQGFLVQSADIANPVVNFDNSMRRGAIYNNQFFKNMNIANNNTDRSRFWLNLEGSSGFSQVALVYSSTATLGVDHGRDGVVFANNDPLAFYSVQDSNNFTIQARPAFTSTDVVAMGYKATAAGNYTISLSRKDGVFNEQEIFLIDKVLGTTQSLTASDYTFTSAEGTFNKRFEVVYSTAKTLGTDEVTLNANNVVVYKNGEAINITSSTALLNDVTVYDIRGRKLYSASKINANETIISGLKIQQEVIIVEINTEKGRVAKKIIF
ncbi:T9SS sorting signal type C domain-containing protein [Flavobacterium zepuense]|uniref:T9SS sorting signal type C domain-containing protein n=1 Tax=Flavobacterium zepuense TaxID=2593302 RepID=A0A552UWC7_9FLAO|nr:T9SS sorting signal type C domain-containing protein [Flavobacterium zepuense]TRW22542.1 T9SS sorting signal type C domain-containing protein [Flavobacterium zepuense]